MNFPLYLLIACWAIFLLYWAVSSFSVKPMQERAWKTNRFRLVILVIVVIFFALNHVGMLRFLNIPVCQIDWRGCHDAIPSSSTVLQILSIIITIGGLLIALMARKKLADNWSANIELKKNHELITTGIYSYMRHPIYAGVLMMWLGTLLLSPSLLIITLFLVYISFFTFKLLQEEKLMTKHFPKEYPAYKKRVKALIPFIL